MQSSSKGNKNDKAVKLIPERNDSSTRVSSKLSSLQMFSTVISLLEGEAGRFADRWFRGPEYPALFFAPATVFVVSPKLSTAPLETRSRVDIRAQLKRARLVIGVQYQFRPVSYHNINTF